MMLSGALFIDRSKNTQAVNSLGAAGQLMKQLGTSLWMFPEGTRHCQEVPDMLPLKKGGFHLAVQSGIPIVPIVAENYWRMYHYGVFEEGRVKVRGKRRTPYIPKWTVFHIEPSSSPRIHHGTESPRRF